VSVYCTISVLAADQLYAGYEFNKQQSDQPAAFGIASGSYCIVPFHRSGASQQMD
jgi:hypothetical protein